MNSSLNNIDPLIEKVQQYGDTSYQLIKLKCIQKTSDVASSIISRFFLILIFSLFAFSITVAIALWIGDFLGKIYYGFFIVAGVYFLFGIVFYFMHPFIKKQTTNSIVKQLLN